MNTSAKAKAASVDVPPGAAERKPPIALVDPPAAVAETADATAAAPARYVRPPVRRDKVMIGGFFDRLTTDRFRALASRQGRTHQSLLMEAIDLLLRRHDAAN